MIIKNNSLYKNILIYGSLAYDRIMDFPDLFKNHIIPEKLHILNVSFLVNDLKENFGGTAGNIAYNLSLLEESPYILASAGKDFLPYKKWLLKNKIKISEIKEIKNELTASAYIITDKNDNQITGFNPGAMKNKHKLANKKILKNSLAIISPGNPQDMAEYANFYKNEKVKYIFDPGQAITSLNVGTLKNSISGAHFLIGNDYEISTIEEKTGWTKDTLVGKVNILIITKGAQGSEIYSKNNKYIIQAAKVNKNLDPTGAGDAYRAGLIYGIINNWPLQKIGQFSSIVATYTVEKYGTQTHRFNWNELEKRYWKNYKDKL